MVVPSRRRPANAGGQREVPVQGNDTDIRDMVRGAQEGDAASFDGIYQAFFDSIYRYILLKVENVADAEDLTEDVFVKVLESIGSFRWKGYPFSSWIFRIAHNRVVDHVRKRSRQRVEPLEDGVETSGYSIEHQIEIRLTLAQLKEAMKELTQAQRDVISLRLGVGLSIAETANVVGKRGNAVKALQHAGLQKLRRLLEPAVSDTLSRETYEGLSGVEG